MSSPPDIFSVAVAVARVETKVDMLTTSHSNMSRDMEALKARRWPVPLMAICLALPGTVEGIVVLLHH